VALLSLLLLAGSLGWVAAAACGGPNGPASGERRASARVVAPGSVADQEAVRQTVETFFQGIVSDDAKSVCGLMTPGLLAVVVQAARAEGGSTCADWVTETRAGYSSHGVMAPVRVGVGPVSISGDAASVSGSDVAIVPSSGMESNVDRTVTLQRIDGRWRVDST
jgi:ketosteroid isomerase-like protein